MSDEADQADYFIDSTIDDAIALSMRAASLIPVGEPGDCDGCGEWFVRTVDGYCGHCRDRFKL